MVRSVVRVHVMVRVCGEGACDGQRRGEGACDGQGVW